jgi:hypothetical protein
MEVFRAVMHAGTVRGAAKGFTQAFDAVWKTQMRNFGGRR